MAKDYKRVFHKISYFFIVGRRAAHRSARISNFSYLFTLIPKTYQASLLSYQGSDNPKRWAAMNRNAYPAPAIWRKGRLPHHATWWSSVRADEALEFGCFRVLLRQRQLLVDGVPVELGTRAFDLLLVLLEADGALVTKEELLNRVWPGIVMLEDNIKVHISALRKALGADRDLIRTEFGRGYRFIGMLRSNTPAAAFQCATREKLQSDRSSYDYSTMCRVRRCGRAAIFAWRHAHDDVY
jgi:DNA-binding winged helix-turn-helix (wHTH) protein